jgi:hypothetical protein
MSWFWQLRRRSSASYRRIKVNQSTRHRIESYAGATVNRLTALIATVGACTVALCGLSTAGAATTNTRVSGGSPYVACATSDSDNIVYSNAEVEPYVASNPARPENLIALWQQDRWVNGGSRGITAAYSNDGGHTWARTTMPFSRCAPGGVDYNRASDPVVSIGPDGTAYAAALALDSGSSPRFAVASAVSRDGGRTWGTVRLVVRDDDGGTDKPWITADPKRIGTAYAVWDDVSVGLGNHFKGPSYFSKTTDFGRTWSTPMTIAATGQDEFALGNQILVDRKTGRLYNTYAFNHCICYSIPKIAYVYSDDGGRTWSHQRVIADMLTAGVTQPGTGANVRAGGFPLAAISRTGKVFVVWQDSRFNGGSYDEIAVAMSKDHGKHWTKPHRANKPTGRAGFTPSVAISSKEDVAITYYDLRRDKIADPALSTNVWATTTRDGVHFQPDQHLGGSFDLLAAPNANGLFLGDYQGLAAVGHRFVAVFVQTNCQQNDCPDNRTDVYSARFSPARTSPASTATATALETSRTSAVHLQVPRLLG